MLKSLIIRNNEIVMYRTANCQEDLDLEMELNSFESVGHAIAGPSLWGIEEQYRNVDWYLMMINDSQVSEIKSLLHEFGCSAWLEYDLTGKIKMVKV